MQYQQEGFFDQRGWQNDILEQRQQTGYNGGSQQEGLQEDQHGYNQVNQRDWQMQYQQNVFFDQRGWQNDIPEQRQQTGYNQGYQLEYQQGCQQEGFRSYQVDQRCWQNNFPEQILQTGYHNYQGVWLSSQSDQRRQADYHANQGSWQSCPSGQHTGYYYNQRDWRSSLRGHRQQTNYQVRGWMSVQLEQRQETDFQEGQIKWQETQSFQGQYNNPKHPSDQRTQHGHYHVHQQQFQQMAHKSQWQKSSNKKKNPPIKKKQPSDQPQMASLTPEDKLQCDIDIGALVDEVFAEEALIKALKLTSKEEEEFHKLNRKKNSA